MTRTLCALAAAGVVAGVFAAILLGLIVAAPPHSVRHALVAIVIPDPTPPSPRLVHARPARVDKAGSAGHSAHLPPRPAANRIPPIVPVMPVPVLAANGDTASGDGSSGEGVGNGSGNGAGGDGKGTGSSGTGLRNAGVARLPRQIAGRLHFSDLPEDLRKARGGGVLTVRYRIGSDGLPTDCSILVSSGRPEFDAQTCAAIVHRFRFAPARDGAGQAVAFWMTETHGWDNHPQQEP